MSLTKQDLLSIDKLLTGKLNQMRKSINQDLSEFISEHIISRLDRQDESLERIEGRLNKMDDRLDRHGKSIQKLEKIHPRGKHSIRVVST